jgi:hypothetical protein
VKIIVFIAEAAAGCYILAHLSEAITPPRRMPARGPREMPDAAQDEYEQQALSRHRAASSISASPDRRQGKTNCRRSQWGGFRPFSRDTPHDIPD